MKRRSLVSSIGFALVIILVSVCITIIPRYLSKSTELRSKAAIESSLPITGTFLMPDMPDSYVTEANLKPMFDEMQELGIDTILGFSMIFDKIDSADPQKHTCDSQINIRMPYLKMAQKYGMGVYMIPIAYDPANPGNIRISCALDKIAQLKTIMETQYGIPFSIIKGWDMGEAPLHHYQKAERLANSMTGLESLATTLKQRYPGTTTYVSPYPLGNAFTYENVKAAFDEIFNTYDIDMIIPQDSGGNPVRTPANNAILFKALRDSVAAHPGKVGWANVESFISPPNAGMGINEATIVYNPTTIDRLSQQIMAAQPYVPKIVTWMYSHTMLSNTLYDTVGSWTQQYTPARAAARRTLRQAYITKYKGTPLTSVTGTPIPTQPTAYFSDVPLSHPFYAQIEKIRVAGIVGGCATNPSRFCPNSPITRAEAAVILSRVLHGAGFVPPDAVSIFADVPPTHWAKNWIMQLRNDGITSGCGGGNYCPDLPLSRAEAAIFLMKVKKGASFQPPNVSPTFTDSAGQWFEDWVEALKNEGATKGCGNGLYCPLTGTLRGEMAVFISNLYPQLGVPTSTPKPTVTNTPSPTTATFSTPTPTYSSLSGTPSPTPYIYKCSKPSNPYFCKAGVCYQSSVQFDLKTQLQCSVSRPLTCKQYMSKYLKITSPCYNSESSCVRWCK